MNPQLGRSPLTTPPLKIRANDMAIARLSVGTGSKGKASPHAEYIAREGKYAKPSNHEEKLENTGHGNMPKWAEHDPNYFWKCADEHERKNGSTYREHVIALPRELDEQQRHELIKDWIKQEIGDKHAYQYAIHNPLAMDGKEQPHCHLMFSERTRDGIERDPEQYFKRYNSKNPEKGGAKKANTGLSHAERKADLIAQRERWEKVCNQHLEKAGRYERISMKSLKEQGIERQPFNLTMAQINKPEVKEVYKDLLDAKQELQKAQIAVITELNGTSLVEINRQLREQKQEALAKQKTLERLERTQKPIEPRKPPLATNAPPTPEKAKNEPRKPPVIEGQTVKEALEINRQYDDLVAITAQKMKEKTIQPYKVDMARLAKEHKALKEDTSFFGRGKREQQMKELAKEYRDIKKAYEHQQGRDFTMDAKGYIEKKAPEAHAKQAQAMKTLHQHASFKYGTREAQAGRQYTGEITAVTRFGVIQALPTGKKIYHDLDKLNPLPNVGDKVSISYDKDYQAEIATADRQELERQQQEIEQSHDKGMER